MIRDVTDISVYHHSLELLTDLYTLLKRIPFSENDTVVQTKRAAKSVPANIAEGFAKRVSEAEFKRFLLIALGSSDEVITHLRMISIIVPEQATSANELIDKYTVLSKRINKLHKVWKSGIF